MLWNGMYRYHYYAVIVESHIAWALIRQDIEPSAINWLTLGTEITETEHIAPH